MWWGQFDFNEQFTKIITNNSLEWFVICWSIVLNKIFSFFFFAATRLASLWEFTRNLQINSLNNLIVLTDGVAYNLGVFGHFRPKNHIWKINKIHIYEVFMQNFLCQNVWIFSSFMLPRIDTFWSGGIKTFWSGGIATF